MSFVPPVPLHISLGDWDGIVLLVGGFGPFLVVAALVMYLRMQEDPEELERESREQD